MKGEDKRNGSNRPTFEALEPRLLLNGTIAGQVWDDLNGNGLHDAGDIGLDGWTVELIDQSTESVVASTVTGSVDLDGNGVIDPQTELGLYEFTSIAPGNYDVRQVGKAGWVQSQPSLPSGQFALRQSLFNEIDVENFADPSRVVVSPDGTHVYAASESSNALLVFRRSQVTGELSLWQEVIGSEEGMFYRTRGLAVSPDGRHVFVTSEPNGSLSVFERSTDDGRLRLVQLLQNDVDGLTGLNGAWAVTVSPDGRHVYTASEYDKALTVLNRDAASGLLTVQQQLVEGQGGVTGLSGVQSLAFSSDGASLYVASNYSQSLACFSRDPVTGELAHVQMIVNGVDGVQYMYTAKDVVVSHDGTSVYVAAYQNSALVYFDRNSVTGELTYAGAYRSEEGYSGLIGAYAVEMSVDDQFVFAVPEGGGGLTAFRRNAASGTLTYLGYTYTEGFGNMRDVAVSPDGRNVYIVCKYGDDGLGVIEHIHDDHYVAAMTSEIDVVGLDFSNFQPVGVSGQLFDDANNDGVRDAGEVGLNGRAVHLVDTVTGSVSEIIFTANLDLNGDGTIDPAAETGLYQFQDVWPGTYEVRLIVPEGYLQTTPAAGYAMSLVSGDADQTDLDFGMFLATPAAIQGQLFDDLDADGVHDAGEPGIDGQAVELVDATTQLVLTSTTSAGQDLNGNGVIDPETEAGLYEFQIGPGSYVLRQYLPTGRYYSSPVNTTGTLTFVQRVDDNANGVDVIDGPVSFVISPDGRFLYTAAGTDDGVAVFRRNRSTGELSFVEAVFGDGLFGLDDPRIAISADGGHLYCVSNEHSAIEVFDRNEVTGRLTLLQTLRNGVDGIDGISTPEDVVVSSDGLNVYVISNYDGILSVFSRDPVTGLLTPQQTLRDADGVPGLRRAYRLTVSDDGRNVYVTTWSENTLGVFSRDLATGELTSRQTLEGLTGLADTRDVVVSSDGLNVYVAGNHFASFRRDPATGELSYLGADYLDGGDGATIVLSADGRFVFVTDVWQNHLRVLQRDPFTGELELIDTQIDNVSYENPQFYNANALALSPDGRFLYASGDSGTGSINVLAVNQEEGTHEVLVEAGQTASDVVFGSYRKINSVGGTVFLDENANGLLDAGEGSISTFLSLKNIYTDDIFVAAPDSQTGAYIFSDIRPGTYTLRTTSGELAYIPTTGNGVYELVLSSGDSDLLALDFGFVGAGSARGTVFADRDMNGIYESSKLGLAGRTVEAENAATGEVFSTTTLSDGTYELGPLPIGTYELRQILPAGWSQTSPTDGSYVVTFEPAGVVPGLNFGSVATGFVEGRVIEDVNGDGLIAADEPGLNARAVELIDAATGAVVATATTGDLDRDGSGFIDPATESGWYVFADVVVGSYQVRQVLPDRWRQAAPTEHVLTGLGQTARFYFEAMGPDGQDIYGVSGHTSAYHVKGRLYHYRRDVISGDVETVQTFYPGFDDEYRWDQSGFGTVALSPDGTTLYKADRFYANDTGSYSYVIEVFARDTQTGDLTWTDTQVIRDLILGAQEPEDLLVSPDGRQLCARTEGGILTFDIDPLTHRLANGVATPLYSAMTYNFESFTSMAMSADGLNIYLLGWVHEPNHTSYDRSVAVTLQRDPVTGSVAVAQILDNRHGPQFDHNSRILFSPDGQFIYLRFAEGVSVWRRDSATGTLAMEQALSIQAETGLENLVSLVMHPDGSHLYAIDYWQDTLVVFNRDTDTGSVALESVVTLEDLFGEDPGNVREMQSSLEISDDGRMLYVALEYDSLIIGIDPVNASRAVVVAGNDVVTQYFSAAGLVDRIAGQAFDDADNDGVRDVTDVGLDGWAVELLDVSTGYVVGSALTESIDLDGDGAIDPVTEAGLYEFSGLLPGHYQISMTIRDGFTQTFPGGSTYAVDLVSDGPDQTGLDMGFFLSNPAEVHGQLFHDANANGVHDADEVGLDGRTVQLVDADTQALVATAVTASDDLNGDGTVDPETEAGLYNFTNIVPGDYDVRQVTPDGWRQTTPQKATGELSLLGSYSENDSWLWPEALVASSDGRFIYEADAVDNSVNVFQRDPNTQALAIIQSTDMGDSNSTDELWQLTISPDQRHIYTTRNDESKLLVFSRDQATGLLTLVQTLTDDQDGVDGLDDVWDLEISPDGRTLYTVAEDDSAVGVFTRDEASGLLTFMAIVTDAPGDVWSLRYPRALAVSHDGQNVYVESYSNGVLMTFARDAVTGDLTFVDQIVGSDVNVSLGAYDLLVTPDGRHVYAAIFSSEALVLFNRDSSTGVLEYETKYQQGYNGISALDGLKKLRLSKDGAQLFAIAGYSDTLSVFNRDEVTGFLSQQTILHNDPDVLDALDSPADVLLSPDGQHVYVGSISEGGIAVYERLLSDAYEILLAGDQVATDLEFGTTQPIATLTGQVLHDHDANGLRDPDERGQGGWQVLLIDATTGVAGESQITTPIDLDGNGLIDPDTEWGVYQFASVLPGEYEIRLVPRDGAAQTFPAHVHLLTLVSGDEMVDGLDFGVFVDNPAQIVGQKFNDHNANGLQDAGDEGLDGWTIELIDAATGRSIASRVAASTDLDGNGVIDAETESGIYSFAHLLPGSYIVREIHEDGWRQTLPTDIAGELRFVGEYHNGDDGAVLNGAYGVTLSPDERHLYVPAFYGDAVSVFSRDTDSGDLSLVQVLTDSDNGLHYPYGLALSPDGRFAYIASGSESYLLVYERDAATGELSFVQRFTQTELGQSDGTGARDVLVSADGRHVYTATSFGRSVGVFSRDQSTGHVSLQQVLVDDIDGELYGPLDLAMSGDGRHVYVTAHNSLSVFERSLTTGELTFLQELRDGVSGVDGLDDARGVIVSPDDRHVYATGYYDQSVSLFRRDEVTGLLTFVHKYRDGDSGIDGLYRPAMLNITPDGRYVMVAGESDNALVIFRRDDVTGELTYIEMYQDDENGVAGLGQAQEIVISADGRDIYVRAYYGFSHFRNDYTDDLYRVHLAAGQQASAVFGNVMLNTVSGQLIEDADNDGQRDTGEVGKDGWFIELVDAATGEIVDAAVTQSLDLDGDGIIDPATESGIYSFTSILPGDYDLRLVVQGNWDQTFPAGDYSVSLDGSVLTGMDFGIFLGANVLGQVFADRHLDGTHDVGDLGQDGWTVELLDGVTGVTVATATTVSEDLDGDGVIQVDTESGLFHIGALFAGDYELRVVVPAGWGAIAPVGSHTFTLAVGEELTGLDFANIAYGDIEGQVFDDIDGNASQDAGEPGLNGWTIELVDTVAGSVVATTGTADDDRNGDGTIDPAAEAGWYSFTGLPVAWYFVRQVFDPDYVQTLPGPVSTYGEHDVAAAGNATVGDVDFGVFAPAAAEGQVFADLNYDALRDTGEDGLNGWTVELVDVDSGVVVERAATADVDVDGDGVIDPHTESGLYTFADVLPGSYEIRLILPELWSQTSPAGELAYSYLPLSGQTQSGLDFGVASLPSIAGQVFYDSDGDSLHDGDENGLNSWTVELVDPATGDVLATAIAADRDIDGDGTIDPFEEQGTYRFIDLLPGEYLVRQIAQNGWIQTAPATTTYTYTVDIAQHETEGDFGNYQPSSVSGQKWHDVDADGYRDEGEVGLSSWTIDLVDATTGLVVATTVTADIDLNTDGAIDPVTEAGLYSFADLPAGDYELRELPQAGWVQSWVEPLDVSLRVYSGSTILYDLETFTYYPYWLEGSHTDFNRDPGLWKVNDDVYANGTLDRYNMPQYTPGVDPNVYWFIFEDTRTGDGYWQAAGDRDFDDIDVKVVEDPASGATEVTGYHKDSGYNFRLVAPDGTVYSESGSQIGPVSIDTFPLYGAHAWTFSLANAQSIGGLDFSNFQGGGEVTGGHFSDTNANGVRDEGEVGLDGWTVEGVDPVSGRVVDSAVTASIDIDGDGVIDPAAETGLYSLASMPAGTFDIRLVVPAGWVQTSPFGETYPVTLAVGEAESGLDFAAAELGIVSGQLFNDVDSNGLRDADEFGINGWTVDLVDTDTGLTVATTMTGGVDIDGDGAIDPQAEAGHYAFTGLPAGNYETRVTTPSGWTQTSPMSDPIGRLFGVRGAGTTMTIYEYDFADGGVLNSFLAPPTATAGLQGLAVGPDSLFYLDAGNMSAEPVLWELDLDTGAVIDTDSVPATIPAFAMGVAWLDGEVYIQLQPGEIAVFDPSTDTVVRTLSIAGNAAGGLAASGELGVLFAGNGSGEILTIDPATGAILNTFTPGVGGFSGGLAYGNGELLASNMNLDAASTVHRIDPVAGNVLGALYLDGEGGTMGGLGGDYDPPASPIWRQIALAADQQAGGADYGYNSSNAPGDMDGDGDVDADDIDLLFADFGDAGHAGPQSDLDGDGDADQNDMDILIHNLVETTVGVGTEYGDANLNGTVDTTDLARLAGNFASCGVGWDGGDFNGSGLVNITDLAILATYYGFGTQPPGGGEGLSASAAATLGAPPAPQTPEAGGAPPADEQVEADIAPAEARAYAAPAEPASSVESSPSPAPMLTYAPVAAEVSSAPALSIASPEPVVTLVSANPNEPGGELPLPARPHYGRRRQSRRLGRPKPQAPVAVALALSDAPTTRRRGEVAPARARVVVGVTAPARQTARRQRQDESFEDEFSALDVDPLMKVTV